MAIKLPRLQSNQDIVETTKKPTVVFSLWWDSIATAIENALNDILAALELAGIAIDMAQAVETDIGEVKAAPVALAAASAKFPNGRVISDGAGIDTVDGGAGGSLTFNLTTTGVSAGSYGSATEVGSFTVDARGRLTAAANVPITVAGIGAVPASRTLTAGAGLTGGGDLSADRIFDIGAGTGITVNANDIAITNTGVGAAAYGSDSSVATFTVNAQGQLTAASSTPIAIGAAAVTGVALTRTNDTNVTLTFGGSPTTALVAATSLTLGWTGTLSVARGGTGGGAASGTLLDNISGFASTGHLVRTGAGAYSFRTVAGTTNQIDVANGSGASGNPTISISASYAGQASITTLGTIATGTWQGTAVGAAYGGTGQTSYTTGDLLYAASASSLAKLAGVATGNALISGGVGTAPSWGKIGLTTHISGTLAVGNGGTGTTTSTGSGPVVLSAGPSLSTPVISAVPSSAWGIDYAPSSSAGSYIAVANNGTYDLAVGSGMVMVYEDTGLGAGLFMTWYGFVAIVAQSAALYTITSGTASKVNIFYNAGTGRYRIENKSGSALNFFVSTIRARTGS